MQTSTIAQCMNVQTATILTVTSAIWNHIVGNTRILKNTRVTIAAKDSSITLNLGDIKRTQTSVPDRKEAIPLNSKCH